LFDVFGAVDRLLGVFEHGRRFVGATAAHQGEAGQGLRSGRGGTLQLESHPGLSCGLLRPLGRTGSTVALIQG
jgi:hypothetical protein